LFPAIRRKRSGEALIQSAVFQPNLKLLTALKRKDAAASRKTMSNVLKFAEKKVYEAIGAENHAKDSPTNVDNIEQDPPEYTLLQPTPQYGLLRGQMDQKLEISKIERTLKHDDRKG